VNTKGHISFINIDPIPLLEASHSKKKFLLKVGTTNNVVHMEFFKAAKACTATSLQKRALFLRSEVRGAAIFP
jgi:hypothetical protein